MSGAAFGTGLRSPDRMTAFFISLCATLKVTLSAKNIDVSS